MFRHTRRLHRHLDLERDFRGLPVSMEKSNGIMDVLEHESFHLVESFCCYGDRYRALTRIMKEYNISCIAVLCDPFKGIHDVDLRRRMILTIIHEDEHVGSRKSVNILQKLSNVGGIIVTSTQLSLLPFVIDAD